MPMLAAYTALLLAAAPQDAPVRKPNESRDMMLQLGAGLSGAALDRAIEEAAAFPLGSKQNPIRENGPAGQRAYLRRLRCADGAAPAFLRAGNAGPGPFGFIIDDYQVTCPGAQPVDIYIDMYHDGPENRAAPGFSIAG